MSALESRPHFHVHKMDLLHVQFFFYFKFKIECDKHHEVTLLHFVPNNSFLGTKFGNFSIAFRQSLRTLDKVDK